MALTNEQKKVLLDSCAEWDFRSIKEHALEFAVLYEYARSAEWVTNPINAWHNQLITLPQDSKSFSTWNGLRVKTILECAQTQRLPDDVSAEIDQSLPSSLKNDVLLQIDRLWRPFLLLNLDKELAQHPFHCPHCAPVPAGKAVYFADKPLESEKDPTVVDVHLRMRFRAGVTLMDEDWKALVKTMCEDPQIRGFLPRRGKAGVQKWHALKKLAAYRLSKTFHLSYEKAHTFLKDYQQQTLHIHSQYDVLPIYASSGAWSEAVNDAVAGIKRVTPRP